MAETGSAATNVFTIYVPLLNEGTLVFRPTSGIKIGENTFQVLPTPDYDSNVEEWEFPPGSTVICSLETRDGQDVLIATARAADQGDSSSG